MYLCFSGQENFLVFSLQCTYNVFFSFHFFYVLKIHKHSPLPLPTPTPSIPKSPLTFLDTLDHFSLLITMSMSMTYRVVIFYSSNNRKRLSSTLEYKWAIKTRWFNDSILLLWSLKFYALSLSGKMFFFFTQLQPILLQKWHAFTSHLHVCFIT